MNQIIILFVLLMFSQIHWAVIPTPHISVGEYSHVSGTTDRPDSRPQAIACNNMVAMTESILNLSLIHI